MPIIIYIEDNSRNAEKFYLSYNWLSPYFRSLFDLELIFNLNIKEVFSMITTSLEKILKSNNKLYKLDIIGYDEKGNHRMYNTWDWKGSEYDYVNNKWIGEKPMYINELTKVFLIELERLNRSLIGKTGKIYRTNDYGEKIVPSFERESQQTPKSRIAKRRKLYPKKAVSKTVYSKSDLESVAKWIKKEKSKIGSRLRARSNSICFESNLF